jgi:hypothetical protein
LLNKPREERINRRLFQFSEALLETEQHGAGCGEQAISQEKIEVEPGFCMQKGLSGLLSNAEMRIMMAGQPKVPHRVGMPTAAEIGGYETPNEVRDVAKLTILRHPRKEQFVNQLLDRCPAHTQSALNQ